MDKQIEEMVITAYPIYATMEDELRKEAIECMPSYPIFERLYKAGYRKIPENAVVLTREEYNRLFTKARQSEIKTIDLESIVNARKETAEKFREMLTKDRQALDVKDCEKREVCDKAYIIPQSFIDEIAKEITEGEKEISNETV